MWWLPTGRRAPKVQHLPSPRANQDSSSYSCASILSYPRIFKRPPASTSLSPRLWMLGGAHYVRIRQDGGGVHWVCQVVVELAGVNDHIAVGERHREAVKAARRWAVEILAVNVIVRAVAGALEAVAVVAEGHLAAQMHADLIERHPVGAVIVFDPVLRVQEILQVLAALLEARVFETHEVGLGGRLVEHAPLIDRELVLHGGRVRVLALQLDLRAELASQVGIEHRQGAEGGLRAHQPERNRHGTAQHLAPAQAAARHLRRLGATP